MITHKKQFSFAFYTLPALVLLALLTIASLPAPAQAQEAAEQQAAMADEVVALLNTHRAAAGCPAVVLSPHLMASAQGHATDMAINNFLSHEGSDGSTFVDRINRTGYAWATVAENVAMGTPTAEGVVNWWMNSPGHRANMLNCALTEIGVGFYHQADDGADVRLPDGSVSGPFYDYWTMDMAAPAH